MGMFSGASKAQVSGKFNEATYFKPNEYIVELVECKKINASGLDMLIISAKVLAKKVDDGESPNVGETASYFIKMEGGAQKRSIWMNNMMSFLCSFLDTEPDEYDDEEWEEIGEQVFEHNAWKGELHKLKCVMNDAGTYTKHFWQGEPNDSDWEEYDLVLDED